MRSHVAALALLVGCADSFQLAKSYERDHEWERAYQEWKSVVAERRSPDYSDAQLAVFHYNFARAAGVTCRWDEAEREFLLAYDLDVRSKGPSDMAMFELGQLYLDRRDWKTSIQYFDRGFAELARLKGRKTPHAVDLSYVLDEYASALRGDGRTADADAALLRANEVRKQGKLEHKIDRTPYGSQCAPGTSQR